MQIVGKAPIETRHPGNATVICVTCHPTDETSPLAARMA
jgi:hypothetical protein